MIEKAKVWRITRVVVPAAVAAAAAVVALLAWLCPNPPQPPDFVVSLNPNNVVVPAGGNTAAQITVHGLHGFERQVTLKASGQPNGVVVTLSPINGKPSLKYLSTATITVGGDVDAGPYPIQIMATSDSGLERSADLGVVVSRPPPPPIPPSPEVEIDTPADGSTVKSDSEIAGTIKGRIPDGWYMWVLLNPHPSPGQYWAQGAAIVPFGEKWQTRIHVGRPEDKGEKFDLWVYLVDSSLNERYTKWVAEGTRSGVFSPLPAPPSEKAHALKKSTVTLEEPKEEDKPE